MKSTVAKFDIINTLFLTLTPIVALVGTGWTLWHNGSHAATWVLFAFMMTATGLAITSGYHRLFSHKTYEAHPLVKLLYLCFGAAAFQNSALKWSADHRVHHQHVDTDRDPYNIKKGFWHAHILWIFLKDVHPHRFENVPDLASDPLVQWQHKYYLPLSVGFSFALPFALGALWHDAWGALFIAGFTRVVLNHHFTFFINSLSHMTGTQNFSTANTARDNWILSLLTYGEGYHNFHHAFPADYRNGVRFYHWDPSKWLIWGLSTIGLTSNLKRMREHNVLMLRVKMQESLLMAKLRAQRAHMSEEWDHYVIATRQKLELAAKRVAELKAEYHSLKQQKSDEFHERVSALKYEMRVAKRQLALSLQIWKQLYQNLGVIRLKDK